MRHAIILLLSVVLASSALAHQGVNNPVVMARMNGMERINDAAKIMRAMVKGSVAFDAEVAQAAAVQIAAEAELITTLFADPETDPKSEALPAIWDEFDAFAALALDLQRAAEDAGNIATAADLTTAYARINDGCKACHDRFAE